MLQNLASIPSFVWLAVAILAAIVYRFIPSDKHMPLYIGLTIKKVGARDVMVPVRIFMMVVVSLSVLAASLYIILSRKFDDGSQKFAYGAVGTIVGHWLKK